MSQICSCSAPDYQDEFCPLHGRECSCLCWFDETRSGCGGCSDYPGIRHEPACGWEWNPDCPEHRPAAHLREAAGE